jgi:cephalosporin-C deacetylase-like acetyl esterase
MRTLLLLILLPHFVSAQELLVTPTKTGGIYALGDEIRWQVGLENAPVDTTVQYIIKRNNAHLLKEGEVTLGNGLGSVSVSVDEPAWVFAEFTAKVGGRELKATGGALVAPEKIAVETPPPTDFKEFWKSKIAELAAIPMNPVLTPQASEVSDMEIDYAKIDLDNINGSKVRGQIARPPGTEKLPAMIVFNGGGVYPLAKNLVTSYARSGWIVMNISVHDLPIGEPPEFYQAQSQLHAYSHIGNQSRETTYFLRMILGCYRAVDYLASRPDWDGKNLIVTGASQGSLQSLAMAALHPKVSAAMVNVPAFCDISADQYGRAVGWPMMHPPVPADQVEKALATYRYFDSVYFAELITVPVLMGPGLIDDVCPAFGVLATFNALKGPKELLVMENAWHLNKNGSHQPFADRFSAWWIAIKQGKPLPLPEKPEPKNS